MSNRLAVALVLFLGLLFVAGLALLRAPATGLDVEHPGVAPELDDTFGREPVRLSERRPVEEPAPADVEPTLDARDTLATAPVELPEARRPEASPKTLLHVVASDGGEELMGVELLTGFSWYEEQRSIPASVGAPHVVHEAATSPIELIVREPSDLGRRKVWFARSPGYAWGRIEIDLSEGGEHTLALEEAGGLDITLVGAEPDVSAVLRIRTDGYTLPMHELEIGDERRFAIDSITPGRHDVSVEVGEWWRGPLVMGRTKVDVAAGRRSEATIVIESAGPVDLVPLSGIVVVPAEWERDGCMLVVELLDVPLDGAERRQHIHVRPEDALAGRPDAYAWDAGEVQPGLYELVVWEPHQVMTHPVGETGVTDLVIEVAPPSLVSIFPVDLDTQTEARLESLFWNPVWPERVHGGAAHPAEWNEERRCFEFRAPRTAVVVQPSDPLWRHDEVRIDLTRAEEEHTIDVRRWAGAVLYLVHAGERIAWRDTWSAIAWEESGDGRSYAFHPHPEGRKISVPRPGRYRIELGALDGWVPAADVFVVVEPGAWTEVEIVVTPAP